MRPTRSPIRLCVTASVLVAAAGAAPLQAQQARDALRQGVVACEEADFGVALPLLRRGVDPTDAPIDSLWELGVQCLVQGLLEEEDDPERAAIWAHWARTISPSIQPDPIILWPEAAEAFDTVQVAPDDAVVSSVWRWPTMGTPRDSDGFFEVIGPAGLQVTVDGTFTVELGRISRLPTGLHRAQAVAPGYETTEVVRAVLPGVTLTLGFDLVPIPVVAEAIRRGTVELLPAGDAPADALVVVRPLEGDLPPGVPTEGSAPFTFTGPAGQYVAEVRQDGTLVGRQEFTVVADATSRVFLAVQLVAQEPVPTPPVATRRKGKGFPWIVAVIGAAGAGAAAFLLLGGSDSAQTSDIGNVPVIFTVP